MGQTTCANGRGIAHQGSGGTSVVFPDVCLTPIGNALVPIPYPNLSKSQDTVDGPKSIMVDGKIPNYIIGQRYFMGQPMGAKHLKEILADGTQRQRHAAALELALTESDVPLPNTRARILTP